MWNRRAQAWTSARTAAVLGTALGLFLLFPASQPPTPTALGVPAPAAADEEAVIPPGQEDLLADMLGRGATLPEQCRFTGGEADGPVVRGKYTCPAGEVVLELRHPSVAPRGATLTERFAVVVVSGSPPPGLTDALASLIRPREAKFEWKILQLPSKSLSRAVVPIAVAGLLGILAARWVVRRRRAARLSQLP